MMKKIIDWLMFIFVGYGEVADEAEREGLIDRGGQR